MARFIKMPDELKEWNIKSLVSEKEGNNQYKISRKTADGVQDAILHHIYSYGENYSKEEAAFLEDEADFLKVIAEDNEHFTCISVFHSNNELKEKFDLYIVTETLPSFSEVMSEKDFSDKDIVEFGIGMADILSAMGSKNIFHGNISPENIYVTKDGKYKLGGFSDFEGKITDLSFVAPEVAENKAPDMTTDIYSVGVIMYYLSNNRRLPFESDAVSKQQAIDKRNGGAPVLAPENGSEKLKSIIVIACQPKNKNRWKNSGNLKNALLAVQSELLKEEIIDEKPAPAVIPAEKTDFEENVFEEYTYEGDSEEDELAAVPEETEKSDENSENAEEADEENAEETSEAPSKTEKEAVPEEDTEAGFKQIYSDEDSEDEKSDNNAPDVIATDVFDDFATDTGSDDVKPETVIKADSKDYGYFFDDEPAQENPPAQNQTDYEEIKSQSGNTDTYDSYDNEDELSGSSKKKNIALIVISIIVILCALGFVGYCIANSILNNGESTPDTAASTESQAVSAVETSTAPTETTQPSAVKSKKTVTAVVGYGYYYAKELLEAEGFTVEVGEYEYSTIYDEGYVISQSPEGDTAAEEGSVVVLDVSLGAEEPETTAPPETEPETEPKSNTFVFANSDSSNLSKADLENLSEYELTIALNEIYARRGRIFSDASLAEYFNSQEWYTPKYTPEEFSQNVTFNSYEQANVQLIVDVQKEKGYR